MSKILTLYIENYSLFMFMFGLMLIGLTIVLKLEEMEDENKSLRYRIRVLSDTNDLVLKQLEMSVMKNKEEND